MEFMDAIFSFNLGASGKNNEKDKLLPPRLLLLKKKNKDKILNLRASRVYLVFCDDE